MKDDELQDLDDDDAANRYCRNCCIELQEGEYKLCWFCEEVASEQAVWKVLGK